MTRPRAVWLLDSTEPTGAAMVALRRMRMLRGRLASTAVALTAGPVPACSPLRGVQPAAGLAGEVQIARAQLVVTTSERTLASAAPRLGGGTRLVHFLHTQPARALESERFLRRIGAAARVVVPLSVDPVRFAIRAGLPAERVVAMDDVVLPQDALLGTARAKVILAVGRLGADSTILDLAEAFRLAAHDLPGWQLRVAGDGPQRAALEEFAAAHRLHPRLLVLGARHDLPVHYLDAGILARVESCDVSGLSVLEGLAAGVPVLASHAVPAARRHVRPGVDGLLLDRVDPPALAAALLELAEPAGRAAFAAAARTNGAGLPTEAEYAALHELVETALATDVRSIR